MVYCEVRLGRCDCDSYRSSMRPMVIDSECSVDCTSDQNVALLLMLLLDVDSTGKVSYYISVRCERISLLLLQSLNGPTIFPNDLIYCWLDIQYFHTAVL